VFALGIVLWEMMTGARLFEGDNDMAVLQAVRRSAIPSAARLNPDVPLDLDQVVMKALARPVAQRHQTAQEFERALAHCVLRHARTLEDTDVAGFLRTLFADESSAPPSEGPEPLAPAIELGTERNHLQSTVGGRPIDVPSGPSQGAARAIRPAARPSRLGLKMALGAAVLAAFAADPRLHLAYERSRPEAATAGQGTAPVASARAESLSPEVRAAELLSPTFSRAGSSGLEQSPENAQRGHGKLVLKIAPWAFLSIDGRSRGEVSGIRRYRLAAGKHRLRLWHPRGSKEVEVLVREGERLVEEYQVFSRPH